MLHRSIQVFVIFVLSALTASAFALNVKVDAQAATAVINALQNPALTKADALKIAALPGNQGIIRKLNEFKFAATSEIFARALLASAHGIVVTDRVEKAFWFDMAKANIPQMQALMARISAEPATFQNQIEQRIALYAPANLNIELNGYIVAGGNAGGYAFDGTDFYLDIAMVDELVVAKSITTHELYHAVQGAFTHDRESQPSVAAGTESPAQLACGETEKLFSNIYKEGTAQEVADVTLIDQARSPLGQHIREDFNENLEGLRSTSVLLEMAIAGLTAPKPIPYDDMYPVVFLGHGPFYGISYIMAKDITEIDGPQGLATFLKKPAYQFLLRYTQLPLYGKDKTHPKLGPNTIGALQRLAGGCK